MRTSHDHRTAGAPRLALRLLAWRVPEPDREYLIGDLLEAFHDEQLRHGDEKARAWFWRETFNLMVTRWPATPIPSDLRPEAPMDSLLHAVRTALRSLTRAPALTALVVLTLALGIGATTSVYSVARAALFAAPPFPDSDRLMLMWERDPQLGEGNMGYATFQDLSRETVIESAAAMSYWFPTLNDGSETARLAGQRVTWQFFDVLGVKPMLGRWFKADEDRQGANRVLVLGHNLWRTRFGSDSSIVGRDITVNGVSYLVAGVLPPTFESLFAPGAELWAPLGYDASLPYACRTCRHLRVVARLKSDVSLSEASQRLNVAHQRVREQFPNEYAGPGTALTPVHEFVVRDTRAALLALLAGVGLVALIACFNAANLLLSRALRREAEFALRVALGASRGRLATLLIAEGFLIALAAAVLGSLFAIIGVDVLLRMAPDGLPRLNRVKVDVMVLAFAAGLALLTGVVASIVPGWTLLRGSGLQSGIRQGARSLIGAGRHTLRGGLVAAEMALAVILISGTSLLFGSVSRLLAVNAGFSTPDRLSMELSLSGPRFNDSGAVTQAWRGALAAVQAIPGVRSAALASQIPLGGNFDMYGLHLADRPGANPAEDPSAQRYAVSPQYFDVMNIPLRTGRSINAADHVGAPRVVLLNEAAAAQLFPGGAAIGRRLQVGGGDNPFSTVVGIVGNTLHSGLDDQEGMQVYMNLEQWEEDGGMTLVVHTSVPVESMIPAVRTALRGTVPGIAISKVASLERLMALSTANRRFALALFAAFAVVALVLAAAGLYGVLSATVVERTREIGVRTALGAQRGSILVMVVRHGMLVTGLGLVVGLFATWGSTRIISTLLFGVGASDPLVLAAVVSTLGVAALLACALPAWRASRVDPVIALRGQ